MHPLALDPRADASLRVLCLGAHADDTDDAPGTNVRTAIDEQPVRYLAGLREMMDRPSPSADA